jgi:glycosyltransferase involved in cell wall biosynthesis
MRLRSGMVGIVFRSMLYCHMDAKADKIKASVGILTLNSAKNIGRALESVADFDDMYICDGNSTDDTQELARSFGARVVKQVDTDEPNQRVTDFGAARTKCVNAAKYDWYFRLDSDEYLSPDAIEAVREIVASPNPPFRVYKINRKYVWRGNVIDDMITYPNRQIRFFRRDATEGYTKITHERLVVKPGENIGFMRGTMYVPMEDTAEEFDSFRLMRALDWDRRHYEHSMSLRKWFFAVLHTSATIALFSLRFLRVHLISRGNKLPVSYEIWRFKYLIMTTWLATKVTFARLFR